LPPQRIFLWGLLIAALLAIAAVTWTSRRHGPPPAELPVLFSLPEFSLTNRDGRAFGRDELRGKVWLASFIFTRCGGVCPLITERLKTLPVEYPELGGLERVSITVDPEFDTPTVLAAYAKAHGIADSTDVRWRFLTGQPERVKSLILTGFKLALDPGATPQEPILHSTKLVLVDGQGDVRGLYEYDDASALQRLRRDAGLLLAH